MSGTGAGGTQQVIVLPNYMSTSGRGETGSGVPYCITSSRNAYLAAGTSEATSRGDCVSSDVGRG